MFQGYFEVYPWLPRPGIHLTELLILSKVKGNVVYVYRNPKDSDILYIYILYW